MAEDTRSGDKLALARHHLKRVQGAWDNPTDWDDLSLYGFYCLEAAVEAAAVCVRLKTSKKHWRKLMLQQSFTETMGYPTSKSCFVT
ncbi:MAG: hypothetical protein ACLQU1_00145 [Bryobacteraceae bacterium]